MRAVHACSAYAQCMRAVHPRRACAQCMRAGHARSACVQCIRALRACSACPQCMRAVHAGSACAPWAEGGAPGGARAELGSQSGYRFTFSSLPRWHWQVDWGAGAVLVSGPNPSRNEGKAMFFHLLRGDPRSPCRGRMLARGLRLVIHIQRRSSGSNTPRGAAFAARRISVFGDCWR